MQIPSGTVAETGHYCSAEEKGKERKKINVYFDTRDRTTKYNTDTSRNILHRFRASEWILQFRDTHSRVSCTIPVVAESVVFTENITLRSMRRMQAPFNLIRDITVNVLVPDRRRPHFHVEAFREW